MTTIVVAEEFGSRFRQLPASVRRAAIKQQKLFAENPFHPSLHTEKLNPKSRELWSFRINKQYRIIFRFLDGKTAFFLTVGPHGWIYRIQ